MTAQQVNELSYTPSPAHPKPTGQADLADDALQDYLLAGVSRTFALTIPQLPRPLARAVTNAYLLCRLVDTIEDEPALDWERKRYFCRRFVEALAGTVAPERFAGELAPLLSERIPPAERELIQLAPRVIGVTHRLNERQQTTLRDCVRLMAEGMVEFQARGSLDGLQDLAQLDRYCYYVAGVVGELLTRLFCEHSPAIARHSGALMRLAVSFGQGLQMTNILKDIWDDRGRGVCWLPRDIFAARGVELRALAPDRYRAGFGEGLEQLIGLACGHLRDALTYTLLIPGREAGIRRFCLLALGMALLTLRKINRRRDFSSGSQVKISRRSVKATIAACHLTAAHDILLKSLFQLAGAGLPRTSRPPPDGAGLGS